jgi:hypothetical protein
MKIRRITPLFAPYFKGEIYAEITHLMGRSRERAGLMCKGLNWFGIPDFLARDDSANCSVVATDR